MDEIRADDASAARADELLHCDLQAPGGRSEKRVRVHQARTRAAFASSSAMSLAADSLRP